MITIESLNIEELIDENPDLSYLTQDCFGKAGVERLKTYGDQWHMVGIRAAAIVNVPTSQGGFITQTFTSSGLWGIESDSTTDHFQEIAREELADLEDILSQFNICLEDYDDIAEELLDAI